MKLGLLGGGFKPFTTGHYAKVLLALQTCDIVLIYYGLGGRKKNGSVITSSDSKKIYEIVGPAISSVHKNVRAIIGQPSPIKLMFAVIGAVKDGVDNKEANLSALSIDPQQISEITIFSDPSDIQRFSQHIGTAKEALYFGDLVANARLKFVTDGKKAENALASFCNLSIVQAEEMSTVRASHVRNLCADGKLAEAARFLPDFLSSIEQEKILDLLRN